MYAAGAAVLAGAFFDVVQRYLPQLFDHFKTLFRDADSPRVPVVDEDLRLRGVRMHDRGHAADIIPVAQSEQRQDPDGGMFGGVQPSRKIQVFTVDPRDGSLRHIEPQRHRLESQRRQVQRFVPQRLVGELRFSFKAEHARRHFHLAQVDLDVFCFLRAQRAQNPQVGQFFGLRIIVGLRRVAVGRVRGQVHFGDEVCFSLVQVNRAGMDLEESNAGFDGFQQRAGGGIDQRIILAGSGADIDILCRIRNTGRQVPLAASFLQDAASN